MSDTHTGNGSLMPGPGGFIGPGVPGADDLPTREFELNPPIEFSNGQTYRTLHLREPTAGEMRDARREVPTQMPSGDQISNFNIVLLSLVTKVPRGAIERMRHSEVEEAALFLLTLANRGPTTTPI